jgi:subtilisin family serine protease
MKYPYTDVREFLKAKFKPITVGVWDYNVDDGHCNFVDSQRRKAIVYSESVPLQPGDPSQPGKSDCKTAREFLSNRWDHGTHITGLIAARANGFGIIGVDPNAMVWSYDLGPKGDRLEEDDDPVERFTHTPNKFPSVINISAAEQRGMTDSRLTQLVKTYFRQVLFIAAAGNQGIEIRNSGNCTVDPACLNQDESFRDGVIGVVALNNEGTDVLTVADRNGNVKKASNFGPVFDVAAVGIAISTLRGDWFGSAFGSSVAAPYVTGLASLLFGSAKQLLAVTPKQVKDRILYTVDFNEKLDSIVRFGRINFDRALSHGTDVIELQGEFCPLSGCVVARNIKKTGQEIVVQSGLYEDGTSVPVNGLRIPLGDIRRISRDQNLNRFWIIYNEGSRLRKLKQAKLDEGGSFSFVVDGQKPEKVSLSSVADYTCGLVCK